jgi:hypothetical protein
MNESKGVITNFESWNDNTRNALKNMHCIQEDDHCIRLLCFMIKIANLMSESIFSYTCSMFDTNPQSLQLHEQPSRISPRFRKLC